MAKAKDHYFNSILNTDAAETNYDSWSYYFDNDYFQDSILYCEAAREQYADANYDSQRAIVNFQKTKEYAEKEDIEMLDSYINLCNVSIELNWNMYEACEYYESASRYFIADNYETGNLELEEGNKKIKAHDSLVTKYTFTSHR